MERKRHGSRVGLPPVAGGREGGDVNPRYRHERRPETDGLERVTPVQALQSSKAVKG